MILHHHLNQSNYVSNFLGVTLHIPHRLNLLRAGQNNILLTLRLLQYKYD